MNLFLYGPSGSGKSTTGILLAKSFNMKAIDLDMEIENRIGRKIPTIFQVDGEASFRRIEKEVLFSLLDQEKNSVLMLGGGTLLDPENRARVEEAGRVICLRASSEVLFRRLSFDSNKRPLLHENLKSDLEKLLEKRSSHYDSFTVQLDTSGLALEDCVYEIQILIGRFSIGGMGNEYPVMIQPGGLATLGEQMRENGLSGPVTLVCDSNTGPLYAENCLHSLKQAGYPAKLIQIPAGEEYKTIETVSFLWREFLHIGLERGSTVVALGGGVTGDLAGFAAATYLRGIPWVNVPTSLLAMVDSSLGGKTGADLPEGKNLIGAFHSPRLVLTDPEVLATLPQREVRNGMAETIKHGVIADPLLYSLCQSVNLNEIAGAFPLISRSVGVKARVIVEDPFEKNIRQGLNFGHTVGHGVEKVSNYRIAHGEAVSIGMVSEVKLAERVGIARDGLADEITAVLKSNGLPVTVPQELDRNQIKAAMGYDKKKSGGQIHFALPKRIGKVRVGVVIENWDELLEL
jgi:3-dehydroquinate synthase